jgi:hypothetical protein
MCEFKPAFREHMNPALPLLASLWLAASQDTAWPVTIHVCDKCVVIANDQVWLPGDSMVVVYDDVQRALVADGHTLHELPGRRGPPEPPSPRNDWLNAIIRSMRTREHLPMESRIRIALTEVDPAGILDPDFEPRVDGCCALEVQFAGDQQSEIILLNVQPIGDRPMMTAREYARQYLALHVRHLAGFDSDSYIWIEKSGAEIGTGGRNGDRIIALLKSLRFGHVDPAEAIWLQKEFGLELSKLVFRAGE